MKLKQLLEKTTDLRFEVDERLAGCGFGLLNGNVVKVSQSVDILMASADAFRMNNIIRSLDVRRGYTSEPVQQAFQESWWRKQE